MTETRNPRLEARLDAVRKAVHEQAVAVDENLRTVLLLMTTDESVSQGLALRDTSELERATMDRCMDLLALQGPVARDLRWAMAMIRVGKDYERVQDLTEALFGRVQTLSSTLLEEILHVMTDVMRHVLKLHAILLSLWEQKPGEATVPADRLRLAAELVNVGVKDATNRAVEAMVRGEESAENLRELVLACRHLRRIAGQITDIPGELSSVVA
jgi:phosphate uptake regulator